MALFTLFNLGANLTDSTHYFMCMNLQIIIYHIVLVQKGRPSYYYNKTPYVIFVWVDMALCDSLPVNLKNSQIPLC